MEIHHSQKPFKVVVWHRQAGKTTLAINELIKKAITKSKEVYWYVAPNYKQAKDIVWKAPDMLFKYLPKELIANTNAVELSITLKNGSIIALKGADSPDSLRGMRPKFVILDEYGDMKQDVWNTVLRPVITAQKDAEALFIGTPKGKNHFYDTFQRGKQQQGRWQSWLLKASESGIIPQESLAEAKKEMTEAAYNQEFNCDFIDSAVSVFKRIDENVCSEELVIHRTKLYKLGVDLGKHQDWTVITPIDLHTWQVGTPERFNQIDWNLQKAKIEAMSLRYNKARITLDSTGLGDPIFDDLQSRGLSVEGFKFTEESRRQLLNNLIILLEQDKIKLPNYEPLINELKAFRYELAVLPSGMTKIRMKVPEGLHDDCCMSLALVCWGLISKLSHETLQKSSEFSSQQQLEQTIRFHY